MLSENVKTKLKGMGVEPDDMMRRLGQHIGEGKSFSTPQDYAAGIQSKQAAGQPLSDPQTAREFQQIAPALFGKEPQPAQTAFPFPAGQIPAGLRQSITPEAHGMIEALVQYQRETPFTIPYAPGTPTIDQTKFTEDIRQFDLAHELAKRQQEHKEWMDRQELALQQARLSSAGAGTGTGYGTPWGNVDLMVAIGADINDIMEYVNDPANYADYKSFGVTKEQMQELARTKYMNTWGQVMGASGVPKGAAPADVGRGFRQAQTAGSRLKQAETWGMGPRFTEEELEKFAADTGRPIEEIKWLDSQGWLEGFMKSFYGQEYKSGAGSDTLQELMANLGYWPNG